MFVSVCVLQVAGSGPIRSAYHFSALKWFYKWTSKSLRLKWVFPVLVHHVILHFLLNTTYRFSFIFKKTNIFLDPFKAAPSAQRLSSETLIGSAVRSTHFCLANCPDDITALLYENRQFHSFKLNFLFISLRCLTHYRNDKFRICLLYLFENVKKHKLKLGFWS